MTRKKKPRVPVELARSGALSVAFANTAATRRDNRFIGSPWKPAGTTITSYDELVSWGLKIGALDSGEAEELRRKASTDAGEAAAVLERALAMRADLVRILNALARNKPMPAGTLEGLNAVLETTPPRRLVADGDRARWAPYGRSGDLARMLWPVALSAAEVLTADPRLPVRQCAHRDCTWLFLHGSTHRRIWCDSQICGNRDRGKRYYKQSGKPSRIKGGL